jgi:hypothetical protein
VWRPEENRDRGVERSGKPGAEWYEAIEEAAGQHVGARLIHRGAKRRGLIVVAAEHDVSEPKGGQRE